MKDKTLENLLLDFCNEYWKFQQKFHTTKFYTYPISSFVFDSYEEDEQFIDITAHQKWNSPECKFTIRYSKTTNEILILGEKIEISDELGIQFAKFCKRNCKFLKLYQNVKNNCLYCKGYKYIKIFIKEYKKYENDEEYSVYIQEKHVFDQIKSINLQILLCNADNKSIRISRHRSYIFKECNEVELGNRFYYLFDVASTPKETIFNEKVEKLTVHI